MREIKFRAWDKGKMFYFDIHDTIAPCDIIMQYTGLKDKNGKEIYEGDICNFKENRGVIEYMKVGARFIIRFGGRSFTDFNATFGSEDETRDDRIEVIGNIYETPKLIPK